MAARQTPPPPDHEDKPVAENSKAEVGERLTGESDPQDPDGLLTLDDVDKAAGVADRPVPSDTTTGVTAAGAAPGGTMPERVVGGDAPSLGSVDAGGDSMGDDADLPGAADADTETP